MIQRSTSVPELTTRIVDNVLGILTVWTELTLKAKQFKTNNERRDGTDRFHYNQFIIVCVLELRTYISFGIFNL